MRITVAISGASGALYGVRLLEELHDCEQVETHLVISPWGEKTLEVETGYTKEHLACLVHSVHDYTDLTAPLASGSAVSDAMVVVPCSMKTLAAIRHGLADNLLVRAADVTLKERRPLLLVVRESPLSVIHLENMLGAARAGIVILPASPGFYLKPNSIDELVSQLVNKILDQLNLTKPTAQRWSGLAEPSLPS